MFDIEMLSVSPVQILPGQIIMKTVAVLIIVLSFKSLTSDAFKSE